MKKTNVLVFPAGEINSVELHDALSHNVNIEVFGCSSFDRHGSYIFKNYKSGLPSITEDRFLNDFNKCIDFWNIDFIFPTHDTVALFLAKNQHALHAKVIVSPLHTAEICRDKKKIYDLFSDCAFCPDIFYDFNKFPVFIKPRIGQGAKGAMLIKSQDSIPSNFVSNEYIISEFLPGDELTVDCITDSSGNLCACLPRQRNRLLAGVCVSVCSVLPSKEILYIANEINRRMVFMGMWYFQLKKSFDGLYKLLEISTRCAGTMCLSRARGVNLPLLSIYAAQGKTLSVFENPYVVKMDRTLISRYSIDYSYDTVYLDYDDTVVEDSCVCLPVIKFLYQCKNKGKKVILISRHNEDHNDSIYESLKEHSISESLFERIVTISFEQNKCDFIQPEKAIFIDNSYKERKLVHDTYGIPVFDVEGVEVLEYWRC